MEVSKTAAAKEFRQGLADIFPILFAAIPIGLLWGTLAAGKGLSILETTLMSLLVFAGALQFVAVDLWQTPAPWALLMITAFLVNIRHVLMGASLSRHMGFIKPYWYPVVAFFFVDESWALSERRALNKALTLPYYMGVALPMYVAWCSSSSIGAALGKNFGDPAAYGIDFAFSALFIAIISGFWRGPSTGAVLIASGASAALVKLMVPGAWYIVAGGVAGAMVAGLLYGEENTREKDT